MLLIFLFFLRQVLYVALAVLEPRPGWPQTHLPLPPGLCSQACSTTPSLKTYILSEFKMIYLEAKKMAQQL